MTTINTLLIQHKERLAPILKSTYPRAVRQVLASGRDLRLHFEGGSDELGLGLLSTADLYLTDAYPNQRGECFLRVWNCIGMRSKLGAKDVAKLLVDNGIAARATTNKGDTVVAFKPDYLR